MELFNILEALQSIMVADLRQFAKTETLHVYHTLYPYEGKVVFTDRFLVVKSNTKAEHRPQGAPAPAPL
jgi:hypothetical protein